jgi:COMPASS component SWD3
VFDHTNNNEIVGTVTGLSRGVFTLDFSPTESKIAIAGGDCAIRVLDIEN